MQDYTSGILTAMIAEARAGLARPPHLAEGLPGIFYGSSFYSLECRSLFPRAWCAVTVGAALQKPGDMVSLELAGHPILVVRNRDGEIRAFHNICRHRAMRLLSEPFCNASRIRCPWHSWTYDLDGKLLGMPELGGPGVNAVDGFSRPELGLKALPVGRWLDYVFVNLDGAAQPFDEHIQPVQQLLADFNLDDLRWGARLDEVYQGNWKLATEAGIEDYHLPYGHPQLNAHLYRNTEPHFAAGVFTGGAVLVATEAASEERSPEHISAADDRPWNARLPSLKTRDGRPLSKLFVFNVFPTGTVLVAADHVMVGMLLPDGPSRTRVELHLYFDGNAADSADHTESRAETLNMWREVLPQDFAFIEGPQATLAARDAAGIRTRFSPYWERAVLEFQRMTLDAIDRPNCDPQKR